MSNQTNFIFLHGRGGSGKDTQAELLTQKLPDSIRLSTGDIYRGARSQKGEYAKFYPIVEPYIDHVDGGRFLPDPVILQMVDEVVKSKRNEGIRKFIFTGFPRTSQQLDAVDNWTNSLKESGQQLRIDNICYVVLEGHSRARSEQRRQEHAQLNNEVRADDDPVAVENKLKSYKELTLPMLKRLLNEERLHVVRATGSIEDVFDRTIKVLNHVGQNVEGNTNRWYERR